MARCFKCGTAVECAIISTEENRVWEMPDGVLFSGGYNYGSSIYDAMLGGPAVEIIICDPCIRAAQGTDRMREVPSDSTLRPRSQHE